jgi:transcriptional regulator with XRE-family HTH domain
MTTTVPAWQTELGAAIRAARKAAGLSQEDLAAALGVRQSSVSQWEGGGTAPRTKHLLGLLRILGPLLVRLLLREDAMATVVEGGRWTRLVECNRPERAPPGSSREGQGGDR